jgi:hypothetical protein
MDARLTRCAKRIKAKTIRQIELNSMPATTQSRSKFRQAVWRREGSRLFPWMKFARGLLGSLVLLALQIEGRAVPVSFNKEIAPIFVKKCLACHGLEKARGGYRLHTYDQARKSGESKEPALVPGHPEKSKLYRLITATDAEDRMPQKDEPLSPAQIALIERWITEGALFDGTDAALELTTLIPKPPHPSPPAAYPRSVPVLALAFNRNGSEIAAGGYHEVTVWDSTHGTLLRRIKNLPQRIQSLASSPDGTLFAAGGGTPGESGEINLIDSVTGSIVKTFATMSDTVLTVAFSPDGKRLAAGCADNSIRLYDISSRRERLVIQQHADWVMSLAFSSDGSRLASASRDRSARIYHSETGSLETTYVGHDGMVLEVAFDPEDKLVYSAGRDKRIHVWSSKDGKKAGEIAGFGGEIYKLIVTSNYIFSCSADKSVRMHDRVKRTLVRTFSTHTDWGYAIAFHETTGALAGGSYNGEVRLWNVEDGKERLAFVAAPGLATKGAAAVRGEWEAGK